MLYANALMCNVCSNKWRFETVCEIRMNVAKESAASEPPGLMNIVREAAVIIPVMLEDQSRGRLKQDEMRMVYRNSRKKEPCA